MQSPGDLLTADKDLYRDELLEQAAWQILEWDGEGKTTEPFTAKRERRD